MDFRVLRKGSVVDEDRNRPEAAIVPAPAASANARFEASPAICPTTGALSEGRTSGED